MKLQIKKLQKYKYEIIKKIEDLIIKINSYINYPSNQQKINFDELEINNQEMNYDYGR